MRTPPYGIFFGARKNERRVLARLCLIIGPALLVLILAVPPASAATSLQDFLAKQRPQSFHPQADRFGAVAGTPPMAPLYSGDKLVGHIFLNSDFVNATGYSGRPIQILVALDLNGVITGAKLVKHHEPIVLVGIPVSKIIHFIDGYVGRNVLALAKEAASANRSIDIVSGATVSIMVIDDSIVRSALRVTRLLSGKPMTANAAPPRAIDMTKTVVRDWKSLLDDGSVARMSLTVADVNKGFRDANHPKALIPASESAPGDRFIDFYAALVSVPTVGVSLLGKAEYGNLRKRLKPGQQAILLAGNGLYSFKGSGYVRGGIFDRIQLIQGDTSIRFRDRNHKRLGEIAAKGAPKFREIALFRVPEKSGFRADQPWRIQLLVQRAIGPLDKAFITFDLTYRPPSKYFKAAAPVPASTSASRGLLAGPRVPLWQRIWQRKIVDVAILLVALVILTLIFFFQNWVVLSAKRTERIRIGFLIFTVLWIGYYAQAQLSVVNVLTFSNALLTGFRWEFFLKEPLIFILWGSVVVSLAFWGRGAYCGWLCPFGALQELTNKVAKRLKVPQLTVPWGLHERLWPIKYILFMIIFGVSFYSFDLAERLSEVEPFKTAIVLRFMRDWWYVLFAVALLVAGLFIERFYCRYLCPLGAALALPARLRMFEWLRRHKECGSPCHICANTCMVQAIHPDGHINPNECLYCLHCQELYFDDHRCPAMIERRLKRERRRALASGPGKSGYISIGAPSEQREKDRAAAS